ncbi:hypothetical protein C8J57DRAFT_1715136 [Mycena rebaudengoi]|nr:hypothetical protein C8J57DRAFT_1715136 [Mycena rebaudengoi]
MCYALPPSAWRTLTLDFHESGNHLRVRVTQKVVQPLTLHHRHPAQREDPARITIGSASRRATTPASASLAWIFTSLWAVWICKESNRASWTTNGLTAATCNQVVSGDKMQHRGNSPVVLVCWPRTRRPLVSQRAFTLCFAAEAYSLGESRSTAQQPRMCSTSPRRLEHPRHAVRLRARRGTSPAPVRRVPGARTLRSSPRRDIAALHTIATDVDTPA